MQPIAPINSLTMPRFCDVPTFMRLPRSDDLADLDVAILGLPSDNGSPFRVGARFGPNAVRAASVMLRPINPYRIVDDPRGIDIFDVLRIRDLGDAGVVPGYMAETLVALEQSVARVVEAGVIPACIGGDHGVTIAELRALARRHGPMALLHFDSHSDTWDVYFGGMRDSAGTPFRRAVEEGLVDPVASVQLGLRGSLFGYDDIQQSRDLGFTVITTDELFDVPWRDTAARITEIIGGRPVFVSFDMDFVDPAGAPGVQTPEAGGPSARETLALLRHLRNLDIIGFDVVETNPLYDNAGQITALLAATVAAELLALIAFERRRRVLDASHSA